MEVSVQFNTLAILFLGKSPRHPVDRRMDGPQSQHGHAGELNLYPAYYQPRHSMLIYHSSWRVISLTR